MPRRIELCRQALAMVDRAEQPQLWAGLLVELGNSLVRSPCGERAKNIEQAITAFQDALQTMTRAAMPVEWAQTMQNLATAYRNRIRGERAENIEQAIAAYQKALKIQTAATAPANHRIFQRNLFELCMEDARWPLAVAAGFRQAEAQLPETTPGRRDFLTLARLLAEARTALQSAIDNLRIHAPDFMPDPSFEAIQSALTVTTTQDSQHEIGVYFAITPQGGLALIVHPKDVAAIWLDDLTEATLNDLLRSWFAAYSDSLRPGSDAERETARTARHTELDRVTKRLWDVAMGPVAAWLHERLPATNPPPVVTLIPTGLLALLPLHAAWTDAVTEQKNTGEGERRYFLDDFAVRYAPSATALAHARARANTPGTRILAIDEPKPVHNAGALPNSARKVAAISGSFGTSTVLQHEHATRGQVLAQLPATQVVHFSCHGSNAWEDPLTSGLFMANNERLTVRDLLNAQLPNARLATLSACETGIVGMDLLDEVIMLPSASFNRIRASLVVKRQSTLTAWVFRSSSHAATSCFKVEGSGIRRSKH
jgi:tetratricopeptide (TPR) repeat protein